MQRHEADDQAERFLAWHEKRGGSFEDDFGAWTASKDFGPEDFMTIRSAALELLVARGDAVITDIGNPFEMGAA